MSDSAADLREMALRACAASSPTPWYPKHHAAERKVDREAYYGPLNDLRAAGLVELTEWVPGAGQGYVITALGREVLADPIFLSQLRDGPRVAPPTPNRSEPDVSTPLARGDSARDAFYFPTQARIVPLLILVNLIAFGAAFVLATRGGIPAMKFLGTGDPIALERAGALTIVGLAKGEWWRLVSNTFLHHGLMHLTLNLFSLFLLRRVEGMWGSFRFLCLYLICGLCGSCAAIYYSPADGDRIYVLAGASGALWGVMMSEVGWLAINRAHLPPQDVRLAMNNILVVLLLNIGVSMLPNVSAAAHFGGGAVGFVAAILLTVNRQGLPSRRSLAGMLLALIPTAALLTLSAAMENSSRLQPWLVREYVSQIDAQVGKIPAAMDSAANKSDTLFVQAANQRSSEEIGKARDELNRIKSMGGTFSDLIKKAAPPGPTKGLYDAAIALTDSAVQFATVLEKRLADDTVSVAEERKTYLEAKTQWESQLRSLK